MSKLVATLSALILSLALLTSLASAQTIVQNRDEPGRNRYQAHATISHVCSFGSGCVATFPAIPAGQHVVVQYVSCLLTIAQGSSPLAVVLGGQANDTTERAYLPSALQGSVSDVSTFVVSSPVVFYFVTGDVPTISVLFNASVASSPGDCLLTGYHVLIP